MSKPSRVNKMRIKFVFFVIFLLFVCLVVRLFYIQVYHAKEYRELAVKQQTKNVPIPAKRGDIYDRNMMKLAYSVKTFTIYAKPDDIVGKKEGLARNVRLKEVAQKMAEILNKPEDDLYDLLSSKQPIVKLDKWVPKERADLISKADYIGVWAVQDDKRVYPYNNLASHVIGFTSLDNEGLSGIEFSMNTKLKGEAGMMTAKTDVDGRPLFGEKEKYYMPKDGLDIVLTIDEVIQHFTEKALDKGLEETEAARAIAIVMNPKTGEILAMSSKPDYNLNSPWDLEDLYGDNFKDLSNDEKNALWNKIWRNPVVSDLYEPGSISKLVTTAAGLEENVVHPQSKFECFGKVKIQDRTIKCWVHPASHGKENLVEGLENSCNPVFIEIAKRLGRENYFRYFSGFGLTDKTGIRLPAESRSLYFKEGDISSVNLATMSIGHGFSVTPLQMITAVSAIGNQGKLMRPHIVKSFIDSDGEIVEEVKPNMIRQIVSKETAEQMLMMMESVVENGSGKKVYIPGIRIGGKTGTTEKVVHGDYSDEFTIASFFGIAPLEDPKITVLVVVDEPKSSIYGSLVAAPIARDIMVDTLRYIGVKPDIHVNQNMVRVPNLVGKTLGSAKQILNAVNLKYTVQSSDMQNADARFVIKQYPVEGENVESGGIVILSLK